MEEESLKQKYLDYYQKFSKEELIDEIRYLNKVVAGNMITISSINSVHSSFKPLFSNIANGGGVNIIDRNGKKKTAYFRLDKTVDGHVNGCDLYEHFIDVCSKNKNIDVALKGLPLSIMAQLMEFEEEINLKFIESNYFHGIAMCDERFFKTHRSFAEIASTMTKKNMDYVKSEVKKYMEKDIDWKIKFK